MHDVVSPLSFSKECKVSNVIALAQFLISLVKSQVSYLAWGACLRHRHAPEGQDCRAEDAHCLFQNKLLFFSILLAFNSVLSASQYPEKFFLGRHKELFGTRRHPTGCPIQNDSKPVA